MPACHVPLDTRSGRSTPGFYRSGSFFQHCLASRPFLRCGWRALVRLDRAHGLAREQHDYRRDCRVKTIMTAAGRMLSAWWPGFVAGALMGFNGYMWSQAVIVEVYTFSVLSLGRRAGLPSSLDLRAESAPVLSTPAFFLFGICFTNHMTLVLAAMGIEILIAAAQPKLRRRPFSRKRRRLISLD